MNAGWTAAGVRGRGLLRRRLGRDGTRLVAAAPSLADALAMLGPTPYGRDVRTDMDLAAAQHAVSATVLWHLRILAGWGPPLGAGPLRLLAGGFEIANVTGHLAGLSGQPVPVAHQLGSLATVWPAVAMARAPADVRAALRTSTWGDPGSDDLPAIRLALQVSWARRVFDGVPGAADWAVAGAALLVARVLAAGAQASLAPPTVRDVSHLLGPNWERATSPQDLGQHVPRAAARVLHGVENAPQLWRAEVRWWATVEADATTLATRPRSDASAGVGVAALLAVDAWRLRAALGLAASGGGALAEVLDEAA